MKTIVTIVCLAIGTICFAQQKTIKNKTGKKKKIVATQPADASVSGIPLPPRQTMTEKYLKGNGADSSRGSNNIKEESPFASGMYAAPDAKKKFDSIPAPNPNNIENNTRATIAVNNVQQDSVANSNTLIESGLPTNSGAVDKSGQAQFGQSNWGASRGTVGEGQWTVPPPAMASLTHDYPNASNVSWNRNSLDSSQYAARYRAGSDWVLAFYNANGNRIDRRIEMSVEQLPQPVRGYIKNQSSNFPSSTVSKLQIQDTQQVYEVKNKDGLTIYIDENGREIRF